MNRDKTIDTPQLLERNDIKRLMDALLGKAERRRALHVLAMLSSVGWFGKRAAEGEAIAKHFGLNWDEVRVEVEAIHAKHGIAPRGGDLRYVSPKPLGVYLALEALTLMPEQVKSLPDVLPNEAARTAYYDRLRSIVVSPAARSFADQELARYANWNDFVAEPAVERWAALSVANPASAARIARRALEKSTHEQRLNIAGNARRHLIRALIHLAWRADAFEDAALALADLAEAENEVWANNATGEFKSKYQLDLGGTALPFIDRLRVIDRLIERSVSYQRLAVGALAKVGGTHESRIGRAPADANPSDPEWRPPTQTARIECAHQALERLRTIAASAHPDLADALLAAVGVVAMLLREKPVRDGTAGFMRALVERLPMHRERVRIEVHRVVDNEKKLWRKLTTEDVAWLDRFHSELEDRSLSGRLRQALASPSWKRSPEDNAVFDQLASVFLENIPVLESEWPWLTKGDSGGVWDFGEALGRADPGGVLLEKLLTFDGRGSDLRVLAAYLLERAKAQPAEWIDDLIDGADKRPPEEVALWVQLTWRCASTTRGAERLTRYAKSNLLDPPMVAQLEFGGWSLGPSIESFGAFLRSLIPSPELRNGALGLLDQRLWKNVGDLPDVEDVAITLVSDVDLLRAAPTGGHEWSQVARKLLPKHTRAIAKAIFDCQARRDEQSWFIDHSEASGVLAACMRASPDDVWAELKPHLEGPEWYLFVVGFPVGILSQLPRGAVLDWIAADPHRPGLVARMVEKTFADGSLGAELIHRYGTDEDVADSFFSAYVTGSWSGPPSRHWERLASELESTASTSTLSGVRSWAKESAARLRGMANNDRKREEERRLRGR